MDCIKASVNNCVREAQQGTYLTTAPETQITPIRPNIKTSSTVELSQGDLLADEVLMDNTRQVGRDTQEHEFDERDQVIIRDTHRTIDSMLAGLKEPLPVQQHHTQAQVTIPLKSNVVGSKLNTDTRDDLRKWTNPSNSLDTMFIERTSAEALESVAITNANVPNENLPLSAAFRKGLFSVRPNHRLSILQRISEDGSLAATEELVDIYGHYVSSSELAQGYLETAKDLAQQTSTDPCGFHY